MPGLKLSGINRRISSSQSFSANPLRPSPIRALSPLGKIDEKLFRNFADGSSDLIIPPAPLVNDTVIEVPKFDLNTDQQLYKQEITNLGNDLDLPEPHDIHMAIALHNAPLKVLAALRKLYPENGDLVFKRLLSGIDQTYPANRFDDTVKQQNEIFQGLDLLPNKIQNGPSQNQSKRTYVKDSEDPFKKDELISDAQLDVNAISFLTNKSGNTRVSHLVDQTSGYFNQTATRIFHSEKKRIQQETGDLIDQIDSLKSANPSAEEQAVLNASQKLKLAIRLGDQPAITEAKNVFKQVSDILPDNSSMKNPANKLILIEMDPFQRNLTDAALYYQKNQIGKYGIVRDGQNLANGAANSVAPFATKADWPARTNQAGSRNSLAVTRLKQIAKILGVAGVIGFSIWGLITLIKRRDYTDEENRDTVAEMAKLIRENLIKIWGAFLNGELTVDQIIGFLEESIAEATRLGITLDPLWEIRLSTLKDQLKAVKDNDSAIKDGSMNLQDLLDTIERQKKEAAISWYQKYQTQIIVAIIIFIVMLIIFAIFKLTTGGQPPSGPNYYDIFRN